MSDNTTAPPSATPDASAPIPLRRRATATNGATNGTEPAGHAPSTGGTGSTVFDDLDSLRLDIGSTSVATERLGLVAVRKPKQAEFFRVNPDPAMTLVTTIYEDRDERETFLVMPRMRESLGALARPVLLVVAVTRQGAVIIWPLKLPDESGKSNVWHETAREAAEAAKDGWVRIEASMALGTYKVFDAEGALSDPVWPPKSLKELLGLAFKDKIIDSMDHPVVRRLRGLV